MRRVGEVQRCSILADYEGHSRGSAIVEFLYAEDAQQAIVKFNNSRLNGRVVYVREDREYQESDDKKGSPGAGSSKTGGGKIVRGRVALGKGKITKKVARRVMGKVLKGVIMMSGNVIIAIAETARPSTPRRRTMAVKERKGKGVFHLRILYCQQGWPGSW